MPLYGYFSEPMKTKLSISFLSKKDMKSNRTSLFQGVRTTGVIEDCEGEKKATKTRANGLTFSCNNKVSINEWSWKGIRGEGEV